VIWRKDKGSCLLEPPISSEALLPQGTEAQLSVLAPYVERLYISLFFLELSKQTKKSRYLDVFRAHVCSCGIPCAKLSEVCSLVPMAVSIYFCFVCVITQLPPLS